MEDYFWWGRDGPPVVLSRALACGEEESSSGEPEPSQALMPQSELEYYEFYSDIESDEYEEEYYDDAWLFLTPYQRTKIQNWIDEQPNSYWSANISTPRSPFCIPPRPLWARSDCSSEPDLESGPFRDDELMEEAYRDCDSREGGGSSAGRNYAYCGRCGAYLRTAAGPADRGWSAERVMLCAAGTIAAVFWARSVWEYLSSYHA